MPKIDSIKAWEALDSRGTPTVAVAVSVEGGATGKALVPSGASTGEHEAHELRDHDKSRFAGKGVLKAVDLINGQIKAALVGQTTENQNKLDRRMLELDDTPEKSSLGANAILGVSLACARAEAEAQGLPLYMYLQQLFPTRELLMPVPQFNVVNGGQHASNGLAIQEYHVVPAGAPSLAEAIRMGVEVYWELKEVLREQGIPLEVGDEGGFAPRLPKSEDVFALLVSAIERAGYRPGADLWLGIDAAASEFFDVETGLYNLDGEHLAAIDLANVYRTWQERYPLVLIEDPFAENAWDDWVKFTTNLGSRMQIIGDDLYVTNVTRIKEGILQGAANAVLVKPNQIGSLSETLEAILTAQEARNGVIISHRSGETEDSFISDLAVATAAGQIKTGAPVRGERTSKYNRLLEIAAQVEIPLAKPLVNIL